MAKKIRREDIAPVLGEMIIAFNNLEVDVAKLLSRLMRTDEVAGKLLARLAMNTKLQLIEDAGKVRLKDENQKKQLSALLKTLTKCNTERNRYVHAEYWPIMTLERNAPEAYLGMGHRRIKGILEDFERLDLTKITTLIDSVESASGAIIEFMEGI